MPIFHLRHGTRVSSSPSAAGEHGSASPELTSRQAARINAMTFILHLFMKSLVAAVTSATGHDDIRPLMGHKGDNRG